MVWEFAPVRVWGQRQQPLRAPRARKKKKKNHNGGAVLVLVRVLVLLGRNACTLPGESGRVESGTDRGVRRQTPRRAREGRELELEDALRKRRRKASKSNGGKQVSGHDRPSESGPSPGQRVTVKY